MKKISVLIMISMLILSGLATATGNQPDTVRVFLQFNGAPDTSAVLKANGRVLHEYSFLDNVLAIEVPETSLNGLLKNKNVIGVEYDVEVHVLGKGKPAPSQPVQTLPWGVDRIDADLVVNTGNGVTVCVVDTGVDKDHPDLQANILGGQNFVAKGAVVDPTKWDDDNGHGTHVAGTIAAADNSIGVVGVASQASLLAAKVLNRQGSGYLSDVIAGIEYCVQNGAKVISMSLGTNSDVQAMHDAVDAADAAGVLLVAAAGNDYGGPVSYPAAYASVVAVSATDSSDNLASFSSVGPEVELAAPGVNILSTWKDGGYATISGTSMATPHVSGVAALAWEANPLLSNVEIRSLLQSTADDLGTAGKDDFFGYGLVDAELN
ncbi:MAG TPA: S8 family peptidase [Candidatus Nanoarchaeia archaeon]|nr:S8 family peptidase [Candidatus Nanoarchaeia archaeon]